MTIYKVGRRKIPVEVTINHLEKTVRSMPVTRNPHNEAHHEMETLYDFKSVS